MFRHYSLLKFLLKVNINDILLLSICVTGRDFELYFFEMSESDMK
jgi:hypothetical protein